MDQVSPQKNLENLSISSLVSGFHALCFQEMFQATQRHSTFRGEVNQKSKKMGNLRAMLPPPNATPSQERRLYEGVMYHVMKNPLRRSAIFWGETWHWGRCPSNSHDIVERFVVEAVAVIAWNHR